MLASVFREYFTLRALIFSLLRMPNGTFRRATPFLRNLCVRVLSIQAQEKQYAAQMARRKETIATLRARDEAPLARPRGYDPNHAERDKVGWGRRRILGEQRHDVVARRSGSVVQSKKFFCHCMQANLPNQQSFHATEPNRSRR